MTAATHKILGELLLEKGAVDALTLGNAIKTKTKTGELLGNVLLSEGKITSLQLAETLAGQQNLPFVNTHEAPCDESLIEKDEAENYIHHLCLPWREIDDKTIIITSEITKLLKKWANARYGQNCQFALTSRFDIIWSINRIFGHSLTEASCLALWKKEPEHSARFIGAASNFEFLVSIIVFSGILFATHPAISAVIIFSLLNCFYFATNLFKAAMFISGMRCKNKKTILNILPAGMPIVSVLVPLYKEKKKVIEGLVNSLENLDYPKAKLDIKLVVEGDDAKTIEAIKEVKPSAVFEIVKVPPSLPRTKPKACNFALKFCRGEIITIFDAEDRPEKSQVKKAVEMFAANPNITCLQARLNYYNRTDSWLTKLFSLEYSCWFDYMLHGLEKWGLPIPLGGTSNYIRASALNAKSGWDPFNVTEDAEIGIRLSSAGLTTKMLDSITMEEAPNQLFNWMRQRSRWIKGYMQTYLVYMRRPLKLLAELGLKRFVAFQLFIGGPCLVFLTTPIILGMTLLNYAGLHTIPGFPESSLLLKAASFNFFSGIIIHLMMGAISVIHKNQNDMLLAVLEFPFYWIMHSIASFMALWQLLTRPYYWEKTSHGHTDMV